MQRSGISDNDDGGVEEKGDQGAKQEMFGMCRRSCITEAKERAIGKKTGGGGGGGGAVGQQSRAETLCKKITSTNRGEGGGGGDIESHPPGRAETISKPTERLHGANGLKFGVRNMH